MTRKQKKNLWRILISGALWGIITLLPVTGWLRLALFLIPYVLIGYDILWRALRGILRGQVFDENFLMALATVGALCIGEYAEAVFVMLFYQVGELFQSVAVGKSRRSIAALMDIRPEIAHIERVDGSVEDTDPESVAVGDILVIRPGERVPLDGTVLEGDSYLNTAALTGESVPRHMVAGDTIISGCINESGVLRVQVTHVYEDSTVARILALVEDSATRKSRSEAFITRFARYYTPAVVIGAVLLALIPSLITGDALTWIERALTFLVISCPCALVISIPMSFFGGIGGASRHGILFKGSSYLEQLGHCDTIVFDKTGTLTFGEFCVRRILPVTGVTEAELLQTAALCEAASTHPIARSLRAAYGRAPDSTRICDIHELAGEGLTARLDGHAIAVGNDRLMARMGISVPELPETIGTAVLVARDGVYFGAILIEDTLKEDTTAALAALKKSGVRRLVMLTGDREEAAAAIATQAGIDHYVASCLPDDKVTHVEALLEEVHAKNTRARLAFVGDGINDAPVLTRADIGIAMGALGSDAAIEAADVVLMDDRLTGLSTAISISRRTGRIVRQNIVFALGVKALVLALGALGLASLWAAVFADVGVAVLAILNAMRNLK